MIRLLTILAILLCATTGDAKKAKSWTHGSGGTFVLNTDNAQYLSGALLTKENVTPGGLVRGVDFTDTIQGNTATFPAATIDTWSWPSPGTGSIVSYPLLGTSAGSGFPQISSLSNLKVAVNYTLINTSGYVNDVLQEEWLGSTSSGGTTLFEVEGFWWIPTAAKPGVTSSGTRYFGVPYISFSSPAADVYYISGNCSGAGAGVKCLYVYPTSTVSNVFLNPALCAGAGSTCATGTPGSGANYTNRNLGTSGLTRSLAAFGTHTAADGTTVNCVDIGLSGTPTATTNFAFELWNNTNDDAYIQLPSSRRAFTSMYVALVGGSLTNINSITLGINGYDSGGSYYDGNTTLDMKASLTSTPQKYAYEYLAQYSQVTQILPHLLVGVTNGNAISATIEVCQPAVSDDPVTLFTNGTFDWLSLFTQLKSAGPYGSAVLTGSEYVTASQFGPEITAGAGKLTTNSFSITQN